MGYNIPIRITTTATIASTVLQLLVSVDMLRRGVRQAQYFLAAFSLLLLGVMASALQMFNLVPASWLTEYGIQIGSALEITLLSFALAHRLELMQTENLHLQQAHAAELEARVQARTQEVALAMQALTEANSRLQDLSVRDVLTGLHNRQFLAEHLPEMWRFAHRWHHPISVLMIDIDHFKQVNDQHGHACGDEALRQVAQAINTTLRRPGDQAIRYGGEEFLVVLPLTPADGGQQMARAILQAIEGLRLQHNGQLVPLTVSIGGASCTPGPEDETRTLLQAADEKLYQAKHAGRNRIEWAA
jgi:diguanylate cyclase (GGDEF)-like protein